MKLDPWFNLKYSLWLVRWACKIIDLSMLPKKFYHIVILLKSRYQWVIACAGIIFIVIFLRCSSVKDMYCLNFPDLPAVFADATVWSELGGLLCRPFLLLFGAIGFPSEGNYLVLQPFARVLFHVKIIDSSMLRLVLDLNSDCVLCCFV